MKTATEMADLIRKKSEEKGARAWQTFEALIDVTFFYMCTSCAVHGITNDQHWSRIQRVGEFFNRQKFTHSDIEQLHFEFERAVAKQPGDVLGRIAFELNALEKSRGQFFTPDQFASLTCSFNMTHEAISAAISRDGKCSVYDAACGSGSMVVAAFERYTELGFDPNSFHFEGKDIDNFAFKMCAVQTHLKGIPGRVILGNTLAREQREVIYTGAFMSYHASKVAAANLCALNEASRLEAA